MGNVIDGHLVNFEDVQEMIEYEDYVYYGGAMVGVEDNNVHEFVLSIRSTFNEV